MPAMMEKQKRKKGENIFSPTEKGGLEKTLRLVINKTHALCGNDWDACDFETKLLVIFSSDGARHQVAIKGNVSIVSFSLTTKKCKLFICLALNYCTLLNFCSNLCVKKIEEKV